MNNQTFNSAGGQTGFDDEETKLPTYWGMPFTKICLGMKIGHQQKFIPVEKEANSLYHVPVCKFSCDKNSGLHLIKQKRRRRNGYVHILTEAMMRDFC